MFRKYTYKIPGGRVTQSEMSVETFEITTVLFKDVGLDTLLRTMDEMNKLLAGKKDQTVPVPLDDYIDALLGLIGSLGLTRALTQFLAIVLNVPVERAAKIPMAVVRSVIQDFFILNRDWLPIFLGFFKVGRL